MMSPQVERMSAELRDELARNEARRKLVDPRLVPLRFHHLKAMGRSAAHCFESFQSDRESTLAMRLGTGGHALLLGQPVALWEQPSEASVKRQAKARASGAPLPPLTPAPRSGKDWDKFAAEHRDETILIRSEYDAAVRMATAILNNREASAWLSESSALYESTILWSRAGRSRRSTPDVRSPLRVTEIKTTKCAAPERFKWDIRNYAYHAQLVDQMDAAEAMTGVRPKEACIIAVEKTPPFVVQTYRLTERDIDQGARLLRFWFEQYMNAEQSNSWGGYAAGTLDVDLPDDSEPDLVFSDDDDDAVEGEGD